MYGCVLLSTADIERCTSTHHVTSTNYKSSSETSSRSWKSATTDGTSEHRNVLASSARFQATTSSQSLHNDQR